MTVAELEYGALRGAVDWGCEGAKLQSAALDGEWQGVARPTGRLDRDTTGALLITDDGDLQRHADCRSPATLTRMCPMVKDAHCTGARGVEGVPRDNDAAGRPRRRQVPSPLPLYDLCCRKEHTRPGPRPPLPPLRR